MQGLRFSKKPTTLKPQSKQSQSGNVFYVILIGIVLFAALMYVFSKSARQGAGNLSQRQAQLSADDILSFAQSMQRGVDRVYGNGCSENQINFDQAFIAGYTNATAPADKHCNVFDTAGGAVSYRAVATGANDGTPWIFTGDNNVAASTFGTAAPDLILLLNNVDATVCAQINRVLKITTGTTDSNTATGTQYIGAFAASAGAIGSGDGARVECTTAGTNHRFYSVLMER